VGIACSPNKTFSESTKDFFFCDSLLNGKITYFESVFSNGEAVVSGQDLLIITNNISLDEVEIAKMYKQYRMRRQYSLSNR